jgi:hypothetical protein
MVTITTMRQIDCRDILFGISIFIFLFVTATTLRAGNQSYRVSQSASSCPAVDDTSTAATWEQDLAESLKNSPEGKRGRTLIESFVGVRPERPHPPADPAKGA